MHNKEDTHNKTQEEIDHEKDVNIKLTFSAVLLILLIFSLTIFGNIFSPVNNQYLGNGDKSISLTIVLPYDTIQYNIKTNGDTLDDVLIEHDLAILNHFGTGSILKVITGYAITENTEWYDVYINGEIVHLQTSHVTINDGDNYTIEIYNL